MSINRLISYGTTADTWLLGQHDELENCVETAYFLLTMGGWLAMEYTILWAEKAEGGIHWYGTAFQ